MNASNEADRRQSWVTAPLAEIGTLLSGQSPPTATVNRDGLGTVYVSGPEQWDGHRVHADKWTTEPKRTAPEGSIFITVKGAGVGKIFPGIEAAIGRDIYAFVPHGRMSRRYVEHALRYSVQDVLRHAVGDIPGLSRRHILDHEIPVPPFSVQEEIVAEIEKQFSRLDEAVASLKRVKANLKRYRAAVLTAAVEGSPAADGIHGKTAHDHWRYVRIGDVAQVISGLTKSPKRLQYSRKFPYLRVANVYANELRLDEIEYIGVGDNEVDKLLLRLGDMLVVEGNGSPDQIGRVALWDGSIPDCVHQNHLIKVRFGQDALPQWALLWMLCKRPVDTVLTGRC